MTKYIIESYNKDMGWYKISSTKDKVIHERDWGIFSSKIYVEPKRKRTQNG